MKLNLYYDKLTYSKISLPLYKILQKASSLFTIR